MALKTCSDCKIISEFEQIKSIFLSNGYPEELIANIIYLTVNKFRKDNRPFGPFKSSIYVGLLWIGSASQLIADKVTYSVPRCYNAVKDRTIFTNRTAVRSTHKYVLQSNSIYKF